MLIALGPIFGVGKYFTGQSKQLQSDAGNCCFHGNCPFGGLATSNRILIGTVSGFLAASGGIVVAAMGILSSVFFGPVLTQGNVLLFKVRWIDA